MSVVVVPEVEAVTEASPPAVPWAVVTAIVGVVPAAPVSPFGIVKSNVVVVPDVEAATDAFVPAFPVVVVPASMVGVIPVTVPVTVRSPSI